MVHKTTIKIDGEHGMLAESIRELMRGEEDLPLEPGFVVTEITVEYPDVQPDPAELTPAEAEALRRYDDQMLFETVSPLALLAGGVAAAVGLFAAGPVAAAAAGIPCYLAAIVFFEWSLRRVVR